MVNYSGTYRTTQAADIAAFDSLPVEIRRAINDSVEVWACAPIKTMLRKHGVKYTLQAIARWNANAAREHHARMERLVTIGTPYHAKLVKVTLAQNLSESDFDM